MEIDFRLDDENLKDSGGVGTAPVATAMARPISGNSVQIQKFIVLKTIEPFV